MVDLTLRHQVRVPARVPAKAIAHWVVVAGALAYLAWVAPGMVRDAGQALRSLGPVRWAWVLVAVACGVAALVVYGELHRQLLRVGGSRVPAATVQKINFVENAVSITVPVVGGAGALAYAIDQLRRHRVDTALASWSVLVAGVIATITLLVLGALGLGATGQLPLGLGVTVAASIVIATAGAWKVLTRPAVLRRGLRGLVLLTRWVPGLCRGCAKTWTARADQIANRLSTQIGRLRPSGPRWLVLVTLAAIPWLLDFAALACSMLAVSPRVPWGALLVGFLLVQASIAAQILPGGAGLAETSLLGLLLASGVGAAPAAASVLIYRSITWLGMAVIGWVLYAASIHPVSVHFHRHAPRI